MPNVMGREFPYTPEGMAAAEQYSQSIGMRDGGPMGFRPLGYADGDAVNANRQVYSDFKTALTELPANELAGYIYNNLSNLKSMAEANPALAAQLADAMEKSGFEGYMRNLIQGAGQGQEQMPRPSDRDVGDLMRLQEQMPQMQVPPQGMSDFPGYEPGTGDFYSPQQEDTMPMPPQQLPPTPPSYGTEPPFGGAEEGDQYLIPETPPFMGDPRYKGYFNPDQLNPFFNPNEIEVANGGYISRKMNNGGLMSLRRR